MAELSTQERQRLLRTIMRYWSKTTVGPNYGGLTKAEILAAVNATDSWIEDNQLDYNNALPIPARTNLSSEQKTLLFCAVALLRVDPGVAELLRRALGVGVS